MQKRLIAHVDMDCFYATCEIKRNPMLAGKPLVIGADKTSPRGVICTASYEARKFGVRSAMPISQAVKLLASQPTAVFMRPDMHFYAKESQNIMALLATLTSDTTHGFEQLSIDEANIDVTDLAKKYGNNWLAVGKHIRNLIKEKTGYSCSVGVAPSRKVAKIAAGYKKPHGVTAVYNMKNFLAPMPIGTIPGIGKKSVPVFEALGIYTINDLARKDKFFVLEKLGKCGFDHWLLANGQDFSIIMPRGEDQSYSREETFMNDLHEMSAVLQNIQQLAHETFDDLTQHCSYKTVTIKVRYSDFTTITRSISFKFPSASVSQLVAAVTQLAQSEIDYQRKIRLLGVRISHLSFSTQTQTSLFDFRERSTDSLTHCVTQRAIASDTLRFGEPFDEPICESLQLQYVSEPNIMWSTSGIPTITPTS